MERVLCAEILNGCASVKHRKAPIEFAIKHRYWGHKYSAKMLGSHEIKFKLFGSDGG